MKKIILLITLQLTILFSGSFVMTPGQPLVKSEEETVVTSEPETPTLPATQETTLTTVNDNNWAPTPLPTQKFNVLNYGLKGDGVTNDSAALKKLAENTNVTNWYFPSGYTFRLHDVDIPSHVQAVYGGGTIVSISTGGTGYQVGAFDVNSAHQDLVIDGLYFRGESGYAGNQYLGQLGFSSAGAGNDTDNTQIRNCTFDAALRRADSLRVFGRTDPSGSDHTNMRIYNNDFINGQYFAMEIFNNTESASVSDDMEGLNGLRVYNNDISGSVAWGIGIGRIRGESYIYNNDIDVNKLAIEIIESNNNHTYNNIVGAQNGHALSQGTIDIPGTVMTPGLNKIHHNHFYGQKSDIYSGSNSEIYENYFGQPVEIRGSTSDGNLMGGHFHNNTVATSSATPIKVKNITSGAVLEDNEVYGATSYSGTYNIYLTDVDLDLQIKNNELYIKNSSSCTQSGGTQSGNTCNGNYSGNIPTERSGAGLSDPNNIGAN